MENFKPIIDEYHPILYKIGRSFTRHRADFDDLYQEMLIQIYQSLKSFRGEARISTWLYRVALNTAMTYNRNNHKKHNKVAATDMTELEQQEEPLSAAHDKDQRVEMLYQAINELKKDDRAMILLHLEGKQYDEIAEIMGISKTNTGVKLMRIRKRLQSILTRRGYERI
jgi:RNA polymerase sigma-70 factor (ECF subfamily)